MEIKICKICYQCKKLLPATREYFYSSTRKSKNKKYFYLNNCCINCYRENSRANGKWYNYKYIPRAKYKKICKYCGVVCYVRKNASFCSAKCKRAFLQENYKSKYKPKQKSRICKTCGNKYNSSSKTKYCSTECRKKREWVNWDKSSRICKNPRCKKVYIPNKNVQKYCSAYCNSKHKCQQNSEILSDAYVIKGINETTGIEKNMIPPELIELKRIQLRLHRLIVTNVKP